MKGERQEVEQILNSVAAPTFRNAAHQAALRRKLAATQAGQAIVADATQQLSMWRRVVRPRWIGAAAAAAAVMMGVGLCWHFLLGGGTSLTLAQVQAALDTVTWVHVKYDGGQIVECWYSLADGKSYWRRRNGGVGYVDSVRNIRLSYEGGDSISQDMPVIYPEDKVPPWKPETAWELLVEPQRGFGATSEKHEEHVDGKTLVRFDIFATDALDRRHLAKQIWADPETRLPVRAREHTQPDKDEWRTAAYEFPDSGPSSIYDLGVPRNLRIVQRDKPDAPDALAVFAEAEKAWQRFPQCYRAIVWQTDGDKDVEVIYCNGAKRRWDRYIDVSLSLPITAEKIMEWSAQQEVFDAKLEDGKKSYYWFSNQGKPEVDVYRNAERERLGRRSMSLLRVDNDPFEFLWPLHVLGRYGMKINLAIAQDPDELANGCIVLRHGEAGPGDHKGGYRDYYLDPRRDYICVKQVYWVTDKPGGNLVAKVVESLDGLHQLPGGQWCAARRVKTNYHLGADQSKSTSVWTVDVKLFAEHELPAGAFNGEKLLEGAKVTVKD